MSPACRCGRATVKRSGGWWCLYCHRTVRPSRKSRGAWERAEKVAAGQRAYYERNREKVAAKKRAYRERNREKVAAGQRAYYERNREKVAAKKRAYYERNREKVAAKKRAYYERNREPVECARCEKPFYRRRGRPPRIPLCDECSGAASSPRASASTRRAHVYNTPRVNR